MSLRPSAGQIAPAGGVWWIVVPFCGAISCRVAKRCCPRAWWGYIDGFIHMRKCKNIGNIDRTQFQFFKRNRGPFILAIAESSTPTISSIQLYLFKSKWFWYVLFPLLHRQGLQLVAQRFALASSCTATTSVPEILLRLASNDLVFDSP